LGAKISDVKRLYQLPFSIIFDCFILLTLLRYVVLWS